MHNSPPVFLLLLILTGILGVMAVVAGFRGRPTKPSWRITLIAALPSLAMLGLFYSLAIHMHRSLGGWPTSIGNHGFPSALVTHAETAFLSFSFLLLTGMVVWPIAFGICAFIRRCRGALFYLGVHALSFLICFSAMLLAPSPFLYWWWD